MTDEAQVVPLPDENATVDWLSFILVVDFYPPIKLSRKAGLEFAASISDCLEPEDVQLDSNEWNFSGGGSCEGVQISIGKRFIMLSARQPSNGLEWYERKFDTILQAFQETFEPKAILKSQVHINGLLGLPDDADARAFLGGYVMLMHPSRLDAIDRPLNILGVRLYFPPFEEQEDESSSVEWGVDVRVESWGEDPTKLFLDAKADWDQQQNWQDESVSGMVEQLSTVSNFISDRLIKFLRQPPFHYTDEDTDDN